MCLLQFNEATAPRPAILATTLPVETGRPRFKVKSVTGEEKKIPLLCEL